ncbi:MAG: DEAD/DEAH box helicase [Prevotellaceae bacterium]|jgi:SNF2 family DNA or RNA helicase|nr:DEAD/DEAH box helicase [Prevotellaceae bacterium]
MELLPNQQSAKAHLSSWRVGALFMDMGTGKTRVAIELVNSVREIDLIVYIAPLHTIYPTEPDIESIKMQVAKWGGFNAPVVYYGFESLSQSGRIYLELRQKIEQAKKPFIILDESSKIKNYTAKRTQRLLDLSQMAEYKLILTGTPFSKNLLNLKPQMDFLSPKILNMSDAQFKNTFCKYTRITKHLGRITKVDEFITGYENIDYLYSLCGHYIFECDLKLQIKQAYTDIRYQLDDAAEQEYYSLKEKYLDNEKLMAMNNNIFLEMTEKMRHSYCCTEGKFTAVKQIFKEVPEEKTLIFYRYVNSREELKHRFPKATILSYQTDVYGLNLQHLCNTIYFDKIWDYELRIQGSRRTYRTGQEYDCHYFDLTGNVGLETLINKNIEKKISMVEYFKTISKKQLKEVL